MLKKNKLTLIITSIITLLPCLFGIIMWNKLPNMMAIHWGPDGNADGFGGKFFAVFALPLIILAIMWICILITAKDNQKVEQNVKPFRLILWIMPTLSCVASSCIYAVALGKEINLGIISPLLLGVMFTAIGNYTPKMKQNRTMGIKIKWTLENEENWNATHRFGGKVWFYGGFAFMLMALLPENIMIYTVLIGMLPLTFAPMIYSYLYYKKQVKSGTYGVSNKIKPLSKKAKSISLIAVLLILCGVMVLMFTGSVEVRYGDDSFTIEATYWSDLTVEYDEIDSIELDENADFGMRVNGFGSARLSLGNFKSDRLGTYTLYAYTSSEDAVVISVGEKTLVIGDTENQTAAEIYAKLSPFCK